MLLPSDRPSSGSLRGPKTMRAITRMMTSSGMPIEPNIRVTPGSAERVDPRRLAGKSLQVLGAIIEIPSRRGQGMRVHSTHMARFRFASALAVVVVLCAALGGLFGRGSVVAQDQLADLYKVFAAALSAVEENYAGEVQS